MRLLKLFLMLVCAISFGALSGCSFLGSRPVYVGVGQIVEIAKPQTFVGWVKNKETKKRELRKVNALAGWYVGREAEK